MARVLIIGGDGLIGRALPAVLAREGHQVDVTSRRSGRLLDLAAQPLDPGLADGFDTVVIAAAVTARAACEDDPATAFAVNVQAPVQIAAPVLARGGLTSTK